MRIDSEHPLVLASASPRRRALLESVGIPLWVCVSEVDESARDGETVDDYLARVALAKLSATTHDARVLASAIVLAADTVVVLDGSALGKPRDDEHAREMITRLAGRDHEVKTRFAIGVAGAEEALTARTVTTTVTFRPLDAAAVDAYVATGEGRDKAGAYAIQGIGSFAVRAITGSYSNVVGLPVCQVVESLEALGIAHFPFGSAAANRASP